MLVKKAQEQLRETRVKPRRDSRCASSRGLWGGRLAN
jgi:hypothetical protein